MGVFGLRESKEQKVNRKESNKRVIALPFELFSIDFCFVYQLLPKTNKGKQPQLLLSFISFHFPLDPT